MFHYDVGEISVKAETEESDQKTDKQTSDFMLLNIHLSKTTHCAIKLNTKVSHKELFTLVAKMENVKTGLLNERNICTKKKTDGIAVDFQ